MISAGVGRSRPSTGGKALESRTGRDRNTGRLFWSDRSPSPIPPGLMAVGVTDRALICVKAGALTVCRGLVQVASEGAALYRAAPFAGVLSIEFEGCAPHLHWFCGIALDGGRLAFLGIRSTEAGGPT